MMPNNSNKGSSKLAETLLNYPSLEKIFDPAKPERFLEVKEQMRNAITEQERVVRRGTKLEAEKAKRIAEAYRITIDFLSELETLRKNSG